MTTTTGEPFARTKTTFAGVISSEWTKIRSVRSTYWSLLVAAGLTIGFGALFCAGFISRYDRLSATERAAFDPTTTALAGLFLSQLAVGVLGVLTATSEYATGMIRTTLAAVPHRRLVLYAKIIVFAAIVAVGATIVCLIAFQLGQTILAGKNLQASLGDPNVARAVIGAALYLTLVGVLGIGLGFLLRGTGGALATLFGLLLVLPILTQFLPSDLRADIAKYLPSNAGQAILQTHPPDPARFLEPWTGLALFALYTLAVIVAAATVLRRRDA